MVAWPLTTMMSCPIGDGAACAIVGRADLAKKLRPDRPVIRVIASTLQTERYERGHLFQGPVVGPARMSIDTSRAVYEEAGLGPEDIDLVQVHDAFVIEELEYYELLGLCKHGRGGGVHRARRLRARRPRVRSRPTAASSRAAIPGGPTGLAQIWETTLQLRGEAGARRSSASARRDRAHRPLPHDGRRQRLRDPHPAARLSMQPSASSALSAVGKAVAARGRYSAARPVTLAVAAEPQVVALVNGTPITDAMVNQVVKSLIVGARDAAEQR